MLWFFTCCLHIHFPPPYHFQKGKKTYGFKDGTNTGNAYSYDKNGNMISDANNMNYNLK